MSTQKPILVVLGATGIQGGSVLSYFLSLAQSPYALRGVTRDVGSSNSQSLTSRGVEMIAGDFDDPSSLDAAFKSATAIFSVTDFWHPFYSPSQRAKAAAAGQSITLFSREYEAQQNRNIIDAAARVKGLEHFIFSSLPHIKKLSAGKYSHVYHFDGKGIAEDYGKFMYPELWKKTSVFYAGFYFENYLDPGYTGTALRPKMEHGVLTQPLHPALGQSLLPMFSAVADTGPLVHALLQVRPGKKLIGVAEWFSMKDIAKAIAEEVGKSIEFPETDGQLDTWPEEIRDDYADFMGFIVEFGYDGGKVDKEIVQPSELGVQIQLGSAREWCAKQDWKKVLGMSEDA